MGELHLPRLRGAVGFIADASWRKHGIEVFHDFSGQLVGQNALNIGCGKQFGGCTLPISNAVNIVCHFPKVTRHSLGDNLLPAGLALFAGPSKAGKSWLTLWLCLQVAQGKPMWGREIEPHTVLYLSLEDTFNRLQKRLLQLAGSEEAPERLVMQTECSSIGQGLKNSSQVSSISTRTLG